MIVYIYIEGVLQRVEKKKNIQFWPHCYWSMDKSGLWIWKNKISFVLLSIRTKPAWKCGLMFWLSCQRYIRPSPPYSGSQGTLFQGTMCYLGLMKYLRYSFHLSHPWSLSKGNQILKVCVLINKFGMLPRQLHTVTFVCTFTVVHSKPHIYP